MPLHVSDYISVCLYVLKPGQFLCLYFTVPFAELHCVSMGQKSLFMVHHYTPYTSLTIPYMISIEISIEHSLLENRMPPPHPPIIASS